MVGQSLKLRSSTQVLLDDNKIDPKVQEALLSNPQVQAAMKKSGEEALKSPEVQAAIIKVAKENLTAENAAKVANMAKEWAQDPAVQAKARHYAGMAMAYAGTAGQNIVGCIEQGPAGVQWLSWLASLASIVWAGFTAWKCIIGINVLWAFMGVFQIMFAFTTCLFEAKPEWVQNFSSLDSYQAMLMEYAKFLCTCMGRGLFYVWQGILWLIQVNLSNPFNLAAYLNLGLGGFLFLIGLLHIAMHYDVMPQEVVVKAKEFAGYQQVAQNDGPSKV
jgi:hypothetical protein